NAAPTATDTCDGKITATHNVPTFPITSNATITWTFTDEAGNTAEQTQEVTITDADPVPDKENLMPFSACSQVTESALSAAAPTAEDDCDEGKITATTDASFPLMESQTITWTYEDTAGNTVMQTQEVTIQDTMPPTVTGTLDAITAQCQIAAAIDLTKPDAPSDNCGGTVNVAVKDDTNFPIQAGTTTITWVYTDEAGNTAEQTQDVTIRDTEAPRVSGTLNTITFACSLAEAELPEPTANDVCDGEITATHDVASFPVTSDATITWTYTDAANNTATQTQAVTITACVLSAADDVTEAVVFPNPSGRYVEVRSPVKSPVRILSVGGELVLKSITNTRIDAASLRSGLYLVQLPDGRLLKFVKK
ncbi:MAG: T9SS type A sorting domain-containing protein, partial [Ekhidna sp.]|nr:T9SS type A sorting domain-containing protein [Ekhidna sp.]